MRNIELPPYKSIFLAIGLLAIAASVLFWLDEPSAGQVGLAALGTCAVLTGLLAAESNCLAIGRVAVAMNAILAIIALVVRFLSHA